MSEMTLDILTALQFQAAEYRYRNRMTADTHLEVEVPHAEAIKLIAAYGSLRAVADAIFIPGTVTIVNRTWRNIQDKINSLFQTGPKPFHVSNLNELTRIAVGSGSGKI